jgi:hypothetical protein
MPRSAEPGGRAASGANARRDHARRDHDRRDHARRPRSVVLVEGLSDAAAVEVLARRRGIDLPVSGVVVQAMGGATNIAAHLEHFGPHGVDLHVGGLYDVGEQRFIRRGLERAVLGAPVADLTRCGFFPLEEDLEDELVRAAGVDLCVDVIRAQGDDAAWELFRRQPFQQPRPAEAQLRRWLGSGSGRKIRYAGAFTEALPLEQVPRSLHQVLDHALG